jgi:glucosyl-3-phosphoglycerate synthase
VPPSTVARWIADRTFHHSQFPAELLAGCTRPSISVCLPARECAGTISAIVQALAVVREAGAIDEIVVIDAASADGTAELAAAAGATVHQEAELLAEHGPVRGKGDAMWRALSVLSGELVCFLDADIEHFGAHFACGLLGPLVADPEIALVKAFYRRPFRVGETELPDGGGRVNHLAARPALALLYPELAGVRQPLAGEVAARRELLVRIPFTTGYGVETAMLLDVYREAGLGAIAQVDLDVHHNAHQTLEALSPMAYAVLAVIASRLEREGRLTASARGDLVGADGQPRPVELVERPPLAGLAGRR